MVEKKEAPGPAAHQAMGGTTATTLPATAATEALLFTFDQACKNRANLAMFPPAGYASLSPAAKALELGKWINDAYRQCSTKEGWVKTAQVLQIKMSNFSIVPFEKEEDFRREAVKRFVATDRLDEVWIRSQCTLSALPGATDRVQLWEDLCTIATLRDGPDYTRVPGGGLMENVHVIEHFLALAGFDMNDAMFFKAYQPLLCDRAEMRRKLMALPAHLRSIPRLKGSPGGAAAAAAAATSSEDDEATVAATGRGAMKAQAPRQRGPCHNCGRFGHGWRRCQAPCSKCGQYNHGAPECTGRPGGHHGAGGHDSHPALPRGDHRGSGRGGWQGGNCGGGRGGGRSGYHGRGSKQGGHAHFVQGTANAASADADREEDEYEGDEYEEADTLCTAAAFGTAGDKPRYSYLSRKELLEKVAMDQDLFEPLSTDLNIGGKACKVMVDTGASVSMITFRTLCDVTRTERPPMEPARTRVASLTGESIKILGQATLPVELDKTRWIRFLVVEHAPHQALLGMDIMTTLRVTVKIGEGVLKVGDKRIPAIPKRIRQAATRESGDLVRARRNTTCLPNTVALIHTTGTFETDTIVVDHCTEARLPQGLYTLAGLHATAEGKYSNIAVVNVTGRPICIPKGQVLGRAEPLRPEVAAKVCAVRPQERSEEKKTVRQPDDKDKTQISEEELRKYVADLVDVRVDIKEQLLKTLLKYRWVFRTDLTGAGAAKLEPMKIVTTDNEPTQSIGPRLSPKEQEAERAELEKMARARVVDSTRSAWSSPVMMVPKSDGTIRFCIDFRGLNRKTVKDPYPLPRIDETLDKLGKATWFSSFDLAAGYWQVPLDPASREKTAFTVRGFGRYHFLVVPMGLKNAPAHFQRAMDKLLEGLLDNTLAYLDDILVYTNTQEEHMAALERYLERVAAADLLLKWRKCHLFKREVRFLGYHISARGVSVDPDRVRAIVEMPAPTNPTAVRRFVAICNYQRHFIREFAKIAEPLHQLTRAGTQWSWGPAQQQAFEELKKRLVTAPILAHPDDSKLSQTVVDLSIGLTVAVLRSSQTLE